MPSCPRVIWCTDSPGFGGSEINLARVLRFCEPEEHVVLASTQAAPDLQRLLESTHCKVKLMDVAPNAFPYVLQGLWRGLRTIREFPRATFFIWSHHTDSNRWLQLALALTGHRFVVVEQLVPTSRADFARSRLSIPIKRLVAAQARRVILNGWSQRETYRSVFGLKNVNLHVIPGSRPIKQITERVAFLRQDRDTLKNKLSLPSAPVILCVARLAAQKDQASLIRAIARSRAVDPPFLAFVGDGPDKGMLQHLAETLVPGRVLFAGHQADPLPWLAAADLFVLPSLAEGLPGALIEAMAAGLPCIATDIPGNSELVRDGETGRSVPVRSPDALAAAMQQLLDNPALANELAQAGLALVAREYDEALERDAWTRTFHAISL